MARVYREGKAALASTANAMSPGEVRVITRMAFEREVYLTRLREAYEHLEPLARCDGSGIQLSTADRDAPVPAGFAGCGQCFGCRAARLLATVPGRTVFNSDTKRLEFYNSLSWVPAGGSDYTYRELCGRYVTALGNTGVEVAGLQTWNPAEHDLTNGRRVVLRAVFQSTGAFAARVRLFNRFFSNYVQNLDGIGNDFIQVTGTTPQQYVSDVLNIVPHANFDTPFADPYEVHVQSMDAGAQAVLGWAQLAVLPAP